MRDEAEERRRLAEREGDDVGRVGNIAAAAASPTAHIKFRLQDEGEPKADRARQAASAKQQHPVVRSAPISRARSRVEREEHDEDEQADDLQNAPDESRTSR